jgi:hypothetical protein
MTILQECEAEFTEHNQRGIAWALKAAYFEADRQTDADENPSFATPIQPNIRGSIRWNHVQAKLALACESGRILGFKPVWRPTGGKSPTNQVLELQGEKCSFTAAHVSDPRQSPRDAAFRRDARGSNQFLLQEIEEEAPSSADTPSGLVKLILVHGSQDFGFAQIRCYHSDDENKSDHAVVVNNIERWKDADEGGGALDWADEEPIAPAPVELRPAAVRAGTGK